MVEKTYDGLLALILCILFVFCVGSSSMIIYYKGQIDSMRQPSACKQFIEDFGGKILSFTDTGVCVIERKENGHAE